MGMVHRQGTCNACQVEFGQRVMCDDLLDVILVSSRRQPADGVHADDAAAAEVWFGLVFLGSFLGSRMNGERVE